MPRRARIHYHGAVYHVMLKGRGGSPVFMDDDDGKTFEAIVSDGLDRYGHAVHAYCWMPNHVHMVIEVAHIPLARIMQAVGTRYTRYVNEKYGRQGPLFQGRYRAVPVDADNYLLPLVRYVHRNPVEGGLCNGAHRYRWSSHRTYLGLDNKPWLAKRRVFSLLGPDEEAAFDAYRDFMAWPGEGRTARAMDAGLEEGILGDADFRARIRRLELGPDDEDAARTTITLDALVRAVGRSCNVDPADMRAAGRDRRRSEARSMAGYVAMEYGVITLREVADFFARDLSTLSRGVERFRLRLRDDERLQGKMAGVLECLRSD